MLRPGLVVAAALGAAGSVFSAEPAVWPEPTAEMKPWVYNWWMGSAVDAAGLECQCAEMAKQGFGGFHVIPIYGAKGGYETKWRTLLSSDWIEAWNLAVRTARRHGLDVDLTMGSGWCFGGPWVSTNDAASSLMRVKRAGPGGAGFMIDPFSPSAMSNHVARFEAAFGRNGTAERPRAFYHDSYEYYGAKPKHGEDVDAAQLACFRVWTDWCRANGYRTRNEAHGAPSNWLDFYALADVPETEMFGERDRDILLSKFASSAAHVKGTRLVSAESCTWIDEHYCERPGEIKRFLDRLFLAGVNHVFYHGLCYSPVEAVWPGWSFYATLEMNPRNPLWREIGALNAYVTRCQSLFQTWESDNDLALVWDPAPFRRKHADDPAPQMTIHDNAWFYGEKIGRLAKRLCAEGYCFDYVSPRQLKTADLSRYAEIVDPEKDELPRRARRERFDEAPGLLFTRWRKGAERQYFLVNGGTNDLCVTSSEGAFTVMDPLDGRILRVLSATLRPGHSLFARGPVGFCRVTHAPETPAPSVTVLAGPWRLSGVCGGPAVPGETNLVTLSGWETFDPFFSGTMRYETTFEASDPEKLTLDLGTVCETAHVWLNGEDLGVRFMKPYAFAVPAGLVRPKDNRLVVEVTNLGANRLRWNDLKGVTWKYFTDINIVGRDYRPFDASVWTPKPSGLLGPVRLLAVTNALRCVGCRPVRPNFDGPNYDGTKIAPYALEDPLAFADGRPLVSRDEWPARRKEILSVFAHEMFGEEPPKPETLVVEKTEEGVTLGGFGRRRQYRMWFRADKSGPAIDWLLLLPAKGKGPFPVIGLLNYEGNHQLVADREVVLPTNVWIRFAKDFKADPSTRGLCANPNREGFYLPTATILARGYAVLSACYAQVSPDPDDALVKDPAYRQDPFAYTGVFGLWPKRDPKREDNVTSIGAWAWALSRGLDLSERIPELDAKRSVATGYSRLAKTALLAAVRDERFAVCVPNQTGGGGCPLAKRDYGENVATQMRMFSHWFCKAYAKYARNPAQTLGFDQHLLLAAMAPRALLVQGFDNPWFDTEGEYLACRAASPVWAFLGKAGMPDRPFPADYATDCIGPDLGYVRRDLWHGHAAIDWAWLLDFCDGVLKPKSVK